MHASDPVPGYSQRSILFQALAALAAQPHRYRQFIDAGNQPTPLTSAGIVRIRHRGSSSSSRHPSLSCLPSAPGRRQPRGLSLPPGQIPLPRGSQSVNTFTPPLLSLLFAHSALSCPRQKTLVSCCRFRQPSKGGRYIRAFLPFVCSWPDPAVRKMWRLSQPVGPGCG
jgi:hypothetical protein